MQDKFTIREVIEQAIQTEKLGYQFYTTMSDKFRQNEELNKLFNTLAQKEVQHEKTFLEMMDTIGEIEEEGWDEVSLYLKAIVESEFFLGKEKALPSMQDIKSIDDAVRYAISFEKETLLYFYGIRDSVREKHVIDQIINEEKSHIRWLIAFKNK